MNIGNMDKRIQLQQKSRLQDGQGGHKLSWGNYGSVIWAAYQEPRRFLRFVNDHEETVIDGSFIIQYDKNLTAFRPPKIRVKYDNLTYNVKEIRKKPKNKDEAPGEFFMELVTDGNVIQLQNEVE